MSLQLEAEIQRAKDDKQVAELYPGSLQLSLIHRHVTSETVGLKGHRFFTLSYKLAGTVRKKQKIMRHFMNCLMVLINSINANL